MSDSSSRDNKEKEISISSQSPPSIVKTLNQKEKETLISAHEEKLQNNSISNDDEYDVLNNTCSGIDGTISSQMPYTSAMPGMLFFGVDGATNVNPTAEIMTSRLSYGTNSELGRNPYILISGMTRERSPDYEDSRLGAHAGIGVVGINNFNRNQEDDPKYPKPVVENGMKLYQKLDEFKIKSGQEMEDGTIATVSNLKFVIDATGSMAPFINAAKDTVFEQVKLHTKNLDEIYDKMYPGKKFTHHVRVSVVGYRDYCDNIKLEFLPLTTNIEYVKYFLSRLNATGGGDEPEDMLSGFKTMMTQDCGENNGFTNNLIFLITDAPAHGSFMKSQYIREDGEYEHEKEQWISILKIMKEKNNDLVVIKAKEAVDKTISFLREYYDEEEKFKIEVIDLTVVQQASKNLDIESGTGLLNNAFTCAMNTGSSQSGLRYYNRNSAVGITQIQNNNINAIEDFTNAFISHHKPQVLEKSGNVGAVDFRTVG